MSPRSRLQPSLPKIATTSEQRFVIVVLRGSRTSPVLSRLRHPTRRTACSCVENAPRDRRMERARVASLAAKPPADPSADTGKA